MSPGGTERGNGGGENDFEYPGALPPCSLPIQTAQPQSSLDPQFRRGILDER